MDGYDAAIFFIEVPSKDWIKKMNFIRKNKNAKYFGLWKSDVFTYCILVPYLYFLDRDTCRSLSIKNLWKILEKKYFHYKISSYKYTVTILLIKTY